jgi:hypothetical protein
MPNRILVSMVGKKEASKLANSVRYKEVPQTENIYQKIEAFMF